jgi:ketosteroid isomerase-like protein
MVTQKLLNSRLPAAAWLLPPGRWRAGCVGWLAVMLAVTSLQAVSQKPKHGMPRAQRHEYKHQVEKCEEAWRLAMLSENSAELASLLSDDYTAITAAGAIETKDEAIDGVRSGRFKLTSLDVSDLKVRVYHSTAVVTSVADIDGTRNDQVLKGRYRYMRVYVRNSAGQWKIVSFEASRIEETDDRK